MNWITFTHNSGTALVNLTRVFRVVVSGASVTFFSDATSSVTYTLSTSVAAARVVQQIDRIVTTIDLDQLADQ